MKGKLLKKVIASVSAVSMLAPMVFALPASAEEYLSLDFNSDATGGVIEGGEVKGWVGPNIDTTLETDDNVKINKYVKATQSGGDSRTAYYSLANVTTENECVVEFDFNFIAAGNERSEQIAIYGKEGKTVNNDAITDKFALRYDMPVSGGELAVNIEGGGKSMSEKDMASSHDRTNGFQVGTWVHSKAILNFDNHTAEVWLTSLDNDTTYYDGLVDMSKDITGLGGIQLLAGRKNGVVGIDNIVVRSKEEADSNDTYYTVTYDLNGAESHEYVKSNGKVRAIPDTSTYGDSFIGWLVDESLDPISSDDLANKEITKNTKATAKIQSDYIADIDTIQINGPEVMTLGQDKENPADNEYTLDITDTTGKKITGDTEVEDFSVTWDIDGFKTVNDGDGNSYCDYYGSFESPVTKDIKTVFKASRNASMNFYGKMSATVTYNQKQYTAYKYVVFLGDTSTESNQILPIGGYPESFDDYPEAIVGYEAVANTFGDNNVDNILGNWVRAGSDTGSLVMQKEENTKYLHLTALTTKKSHMASQKITTPTSQVIFEQNVRFNNASGCITFTSGYPIWQEKNYSVALSLNFTGNSFDLNGTPLTNGDVAAAASSQKWYKIVISADKTTETCFAKVYDADNGELVGEANNVKWQVSCAPTFYAVGMGSEPTGSVDFGNCKAYYPVVDTNNYTLEATQTTLSIPLKETAELTASLKTADGYDITGAATWEVIESDMKDGVIVTPNPSDSHKAVVSLAENAAPGTATIQVNIGGNVKQIKLNIVSSDENIKFTKFSSSVSIPLDASKNTEVKYEAVVATGSGEPIEGRTVTYAVYDRTNTSAITLPEGITFDVDTGVLTVTSAAKACTFSIRATGKNTDGADISRAISVTVHGLAFDFGEGTDEDIAEGYTEITPTTAYTDDRGYGISGTVTAGGEKSTDNADSDYLDGMLTFKAKVEPKKFYTVEVTYRGAISAEPAHKFSDSTLINELSEYFVGGNQTLSKVKYTIPVLDDVLDLTFTEYKWQTKGQDTPKDTTDDEYETVQPQVASIVITKEADRTATAKPTIYTVGDSTISNNGSWAYYITHNQAKYQELYDVVNFNNNGRGGSNLVKYYTSGDFYDRVLKNIKPGDIMMIGDMGTNGMGNTFEDDFNYFIDAVEALGGKIIINSYSPHGAKNGMESCYNAETQTFTSWRQNNYDVIARKIADERKENDENYLGFVEIGKEADKSFNAYVDDFAAKGYDSRNAAAQAIIAAFSDNNHYSGIASELIVDGYGDGLGIPEQIIALVTAEPTKTHTVTFTGDNATVTVDGETVTSTTVKDGDSVKFTVTAAEGYEVKEVKAGENVLEAVEGVYTLTDVTADTTVTITTEKVVVPESWIKYEATYENGVLKNVEITPNATPESVNNDETHKIFFWNEKMQPWTAE